MFQDFKILFCPACSEEVKAKTSNFCDKCGLCFKKKCKSCEVFGFWEHCYECGVKMVIFTGLNTTISIQEIVSQTKVIEKSSDSNIESEPSRKAKKRSSKRSSNEIFKIKVAILSANKKSINQDVGGGSRHIQLEKSVTYQEIFRNIIKIYFPKDSVSRIGHKEDYKLSLLDFKKEKIDENQFTNLGSYMSINGLNLINSLFYLLLTKQMKTGLPKQTNPSVAKPLITKQTKMETSSSEESSEDEEKSKPNQINRVNSSQKKVKTPLTASKVVSSSDSSDSNSSTSSFVRQKKLVKKTNEILTKEIKVEPIANPVSSPEISTAQKPKPTVESTIARSIGSEKSSTESQNSSSLPRDNSNHNTSSHSNYSRYEYNNTRQNYNSSYHNNRYRPDNQYNRNYYHNTNNYNNQRPNHGSSYHYNKRDSKNLNEDFSQNSYY